MFPIKLLCNIDDSNSYILFPNNRIVVMILLDPAYLHIYVFEVQCSSQWLHYDNLRKIKKLINNLISMNCEKLP